VNGKVVGVVLVVSGLIAGGAMYYLQVYGYYHAVEPAGVGDVQVTAIASGKPEAIRYENFKAIDAESSPLRYRACFDTPMSQAMMTETYQIYGDPVPLVGPSWFSCYDAKAIGEALEAGGAVAYLGTKNIHWGVDRVVAVTRDGHGYVWQQINACGEEVFAGRDAPEGCPPLPQNMVGSE